MKNMASTTGKAFENKFRNWHKGLDCITFKVPDYGSSGSIQYALCDRITLTPKGTFFFECKHTESKTSFNLGQIKSHQMRSMLKLHEMDAFAFFLIEDGNHNVYMITPDIVELYEKSIKFAEIKDFIVKKAQFQKLIYENVYSE